MGEVSWTKVSIEVVWSLVAGLLFAVFTNLFDSYNGSSQFNIGSFVERELFNWGHWGVFDEFIFGFAIAMIIIWTVKLYKKVR